MPLAPKMAAGADVASFETSALSCAAVVADTVRLPPTVSDVFVMYASVSAGFSPLNADEMSGSPSNASSGGEEHVRRVPADRVEREQDADGLVAGARRGEESSRRSARGSVRLDRHVAGRVGTVLESTNARAPLSSAVRRDDRVDRKRCALAVPRAAARGGGRAVGERVDEGLLGRRDLEAADRVPDIADGAVDDVRLDVAAQVVEHDEPAEADRVRRREVEVLRDDLRERERLPPAEVGVHMVRIVWVDRRAARAHPLVDTPRVARDRLPQRRVAVVLRVDVELLAGADVLVERAGLAAERGPEARVAVSAAPRSSRAFGPR